MMTTTRRVYLRLPLMILFILFALAVSPALVSADAVPDDPDVADVVDDGGVSEDEDVDAEAPAFNNPAQAQKAENVANAAARNSNDPELAEAVEKAEDAEQELAEARRNLRNLPDDATDDEKSAARQAVRDARQDVREARTAVADRLSEISGEYQEDISQMRDDGYGWGEIAKSYGLHPSVLGNKYGHQKPEHHMERNRYTNRKNDAFEEATTRDVKSGWAKGHGVSASGKSNGVNKGNADALDSGMSGKSKGKSNGIGGGNGNGNGNGKGNGKGGGNGKK